MNLDSIMDRAFTLLEKSLKDKQEESKANLQHLMDMQKMKLSSQEKIQTLINKGALDKQELVNQGLLSRQELENSGLIDRQKQSDEGAYERSKLASNTGIKVANINAKSKLDTDYHTVKQYGPDGLPVNERLINPNRQMSVPFPGSETTTPEETAATFSSVQPGQIAGPSISASSMQTPRSALGGVGNPGTGIVQAGGRTFEIRNNVENEVGPPFQPARSIPVAPVESAPASQVQNASPSVSTPPVSMIPEAGAGRHTSTRSAEASPQRRPLSQNYDQISKGEFQGPYVFHPEQFETLPSKIKRGVSAIGRALYPNGLPKDPYPNGLANYVRGNKGKIKNRRRGVYEDEIGGY